jgi:peptide/nickel transport system substrate-binding protein
MKRYLSPLFVVAVVLALVLPVALPDYARSASLPADTLVMGISSLFDETFLPWNGSVGRKLYLDPIYEYLVYLDPQTRKPMPGLATKWEMSKDGKVWTFSLRKGVQFHEGWGELTADDVKYSLERAMDPKSILGPGSTLRRLVSKIETPDKYRVTFTLNIPDVEFERGYMANGLPFAIVCKKYIEEKGDAAANAHPVGTGPYALAEANRGTSIKLKAAPGVEKHWRVRPDFHNINILGVPEESTRVAMLKAGEVDLVPINYDSIDSIKAAGFNVLAVKNNWAPLIRLGGLVKTNPKVYNPNVPWADKRVRQALNYAVNKNDIITNIFHGQARPSGGDFPAPEWLSIPPYPYDPQKAKQLLAEAGYPNGFPIQLKTFTTSPGAELPVIGQAVAMYWEAVGIKATIVPSDWPTVRGMVASGKATDFAWTHRGPAFTSTAVGLQASSISNSAQATFANEMTEARMAEIDKTLDIKKRAALLRQAGEYLREEAGCVYIAFADEPYGASKRLAKWPTLSEYTTNLDLIVRKK